MGKWVVLILVVVIGLGLWTAVDPGARATMHTAWINGTTALGVQSTGIDAASLWAPVGRAFQHFADSVGGLLSPRSIRIDMPSVNVRP